MIVDVATRLAQRGLRVGLATVFDDDRRGRAQKARLAERRVDVGGVRLEAAATGLVVVDAVGGELDVLAERGASREFEIPRGWSSQVLLVSGLSPLTSKAAALCRAARRARRDGAIVVLDASGSLRQWAGRDPRTMAMVVREAHVVRCSVLDLAILGTDAASFRRALRADATLVVCDGAGAIATGPFGELRADCDRATDDADERCTTAICDELARPARAVESDAGRWHRLLLSA
jgi:sugar/nucleoside kinase (ribokinase family)